MSQHRRRQNSLCSKIMRKLFVVIDMHFGTRRLLIDLSEDDTLLQCLRSFRHPHRVDVARGGIERAGEVQVQPPEADDKEQRDL